MSAVEKMNILSDIQYQEDRSLSLDIRYFCDEVELVAETFSIVFKHCISINTYMDLIYKTLPIKYQQNMYRKFTVISIDIEDCEFTSGGLLGYRDRDKKIIAEGYKTKVDLDELSLEIISLDIDIETSISNEQKIKNSITYVDV